MAVRPRKKGKKAKVNGGEGAGRPTVMTPEVMAKLQEAFMMDLSKRQACIYADISEDALYDYISANPEYNGKIARWQDSVNLRARANISRAIEVGDPIISKWRLEKRDKDYQTASKVDLSSSDGTMTPQPAIIQIVPG